MSLPRVVLYGRPGCCLCDEALELLQGLARRLQFETDVVNIESDDELHRKFLYEIPVVAVEGRVIARAPIRKGALEDALREALRR